MFAWRSCALVHLFVTWVVTKAQPSTSSGRDCEFLKYHNHGTFSGVTAQNASDMYYSSRKMYFVCRWNIHVSKNIVSLKFNRFKFSGKWPDCSKGSSLTIFDYSRRMSNYIFNVTYCGSKKPPIFYSEGPEVDIVVKGNVEKFLLSHDIRFVGDFSITYNAESFSPTVKTPCGQCGGKHVAERGRLYSPKFPGKYPPKCDCTWSITFKEGYLVKFHFLSFQLENKRNDKCDDFVSIHDGASVLSPIIRKSCGNLLPTDVQTTGSKAVVRFFSDFSNQDRGFDLVYESIKEERDLSGLRSIAAILGGVSFGIFVFLLLCSVLYKRYVGDQRSPTSCGEHCDNRGDDYVDAVQAGAPPSYQIVMAAPDMYPRTPDMSPNASPDGSPTASPTPVRSNRPPRLQHTSCGLYVATNTTLSDADASDLPLTPPPPYSAIIRENQISFDDYPPPPSYEILSDSSDQEERRDRETEGQPNHEVAAGGDSSALISEEEHLARNTHVDRSQLVPQIGRLSLSDAVTNRRTRDLQVSRSGEPSVSPCGSNSSNTRRFPGSRSLSNFFYSAASKALHRQASDGRIWARKRNDQETERFAADLALSLSSLRRRQETETTDLDEQCESVAFDVDQEDDIESISGPSQSLEPEDMTTASSFDRFTLSRHQHAPNSANGPLSEMHSLCSESGSMRSVDRMSTQSASSRQCLVNLSGASRSTAQYSQSNRNRSGSGSRHSFIRSRNLRL